MSLFCADVRWMNSGPIKFASLVAFVFLVVGSANVQAQQTWLAQSAAPDAGPKTLFRWSVDTQPHLVDDNAPDTLVTDRPHFSEASSLVGFGHVQIESGYTYFGDRSDGVRTITHSFPETLFRIGMLADWFEFRLAYNYLVESSAGRTVSGSDDLYVGAKLALTEQAGWLPEIALFPQARLPTGVNAFSSDQILPGFNLAYSWKINDFIELECNTQLNRRRDEVNHYYTEFIQTANIEYTLTKRLGAFTEWFGFMPNGALAASPQHYLHGGFVYLFTDNLQYDIHAAVGANRHADDYFAGTGLSYRY